MMKLHDIVQTHRVIAELRELDELTSDNSGAQRVAWTPTWVRARTWLRERLAELPVEIEVDAAGNLSARLPGVSSRELLIGGHIDSVPNGGWLDGALNVVAGLEVLRAASQRDTPPPIGIRLVDWADEEGARFGYSTFGSGAAAGAVEPAKVRDLRDSQDITLEQAVADHGVDIERVRDARATLERAAGYIELHIEQGPVLEDLGLPLAVVTGTAGVERHIVSFSGQEAHAGSTPMAMRRDAFAAAARTSLAIRDEAASTVGAVGTVGRCDALPGIVTIVPGQCSLHIDQRHTDASVLARLHSHAQAAAATIAREEKVAVEWAPLWDIEPISFDPTLIGLAEEAVIEVASESHRMPSGALHDAAAVARSGVPTVMLFVQSLRGLSHAKDEDTNPEHLALAVEALALLVDKALDRLKHAST